MANEQRVSVSDYIHIRICSSNQRNVKKTISDLSPKWQEKKGC